MAVKTKWAIIGTGYIANQFAFGMRAVEDAILEAVVSRSENSGKKFAQKYGCEKVYTDLKTMLDTEKIDIVYLAIPNSCHFEYIMEILEREVPMPVDQIGKNGVGSEFIVGENKELEDE